MECMANSDNVVRAGLTPKEKDVKTLCEMLTYKDEHPQLLKPEAIDSNCSLYKPNSQCQEFALEKIEINANASYNIHPSGSGSILLVHRGSGSVKDAKTGQQLSISQGAILYLGANQPLECKTESNAILIFRCRAGLHE